MCACPGDALYSFILFTWMCACMYVHIVHADEGQRTVYGSWFSLSPSTIRVPGIEFMMLA